METEARIAANPPQMTMWLNAGGGGLPTPKLAEKNDSRIGCSPTDGRLLAAGSTSRMRQYQLRNAAWRPLIPRYLFLRASEHQLRSIMSASDDALSRRGPCVAGRNHEFPPEHRPLESLPVTILPLRRARAHIGRERLAGAVAEPHLPVS